MPEAETNTLSPERLRSIVCALCGELMTNDAVYGPLRAAVIFRARQERVVHPAGTFDNGGRFFAGPEENFPAGRYRPPSRSYPWSHMTACRSLLHVATRLIRLDDDGVRQARRLARHSWDDLFAHCIRELDTETAVAIFGLDGEPPHDDGNNTKRDMPPVAS